MQMVTKLDARVGVIMVFAWLLGLGTEGPFPHIERTAAHVEATSVRSWKEGLVCSEA